jgi:hypothetical protein
MIVRLRTKATEFFFFFMIKTLGECTFLRNTFGKHVYYIEGHLLPLAGIIWLGVSNSVLSFLYWPSCESLLTILLPVRRFWHGTVLGHCKKCRNILRVGGCINLWLIVWADKFAKPIMIFCLSSILKERSWPALIVLAVMKPRGQLLKMNWVLYHLSSKVHVVLENGYPMLVWTELLVSISTDLEYLYFVMWTSANFQRNLMDD